MLSLSFTPLIPWPAIAVLGVIVAVLAVFAVLARGRTAWLRALVLALVLAALTNPALVREDREPVKDVAAIVVDRSGSQALGDRAQQHVAGLMTQRIVDLLEAIQIDEDDGHARVQLASAGDGLRREHAEHASIGQAGEAVGEGQLTDAGTRFVALEGQLAKVYAHVDESFMQGIRAAHGAVIECEHTEHAPIVCDDRHGPRGG